MGAAAPGLDGAYTDMYCHVLSRALFYDPATFAKQLAVNGIPEDTILLAITFTAYDADYYPAEKETAVKAIEDAVEKGSFTELQATRAQLLTDYLTTPPIEGWVQLPTPP